MFTFSPKIRKTKIIFMYSKRQRFQMFWSWDFIIWNCRSLFIWTAGMSGSRGKTATPSIRKWLGVRASWSQGILENEVNERELRMDFTRHIKLFISLNINNVPFIVLNNLCLADLTAAFHGPLKWEAEGGLKCHYTSWLVSMLITDGVELVVWK